MERTDFLDPLQATVLLVEDEEILRALLVRVLINEGFQVAEAANGQTALELAALHQGNLRLVVTDIHMPFMSGVEFAREFRRRNPTVPVVYMTGRTATVPTVQPNEELLRKPFTIDEFLGVVRRILAAVG